MSSLQPRSSATWAYWLTAAALSSVVASIAICHILLALALVALLLSREPLRFPPVKLPLAAFIVWTVVSLLVSTDPAAGRPQIRKFFVWVVLVLISSTFRQLRAILPVVVAWVLLGTASAVVGFLQFMRKWEEARQLGVDFYHYYVGERVTGFMSHWMTWSGQLMLLSLVLLAWWTLGPLKRWQRVLLATCTAVMGCALAIGFTRSVWLATACASMYLLWHWRRWTLVAIPIAMLSLLLWNPARIRDRAFSMFRPHGERDSNQHRIVSWRIGWNIIRRHPWFGLGPEHIKLRYEDYVPPDVQRPLPEGWYGHLHNIYLHYAAERGLPALAALLWLLGKMLWDMRRALTRASRPTRWVLHAALASIIAILVEGFFELNLGDTEVLTVFLTIIGFGYVAAEQNSTESQYAQS